MKSFLFLLRTATFATTVVAATFDSVDGPPVELDKLEVNAAKEAVFSLPLDSNPATGSRLGLANRETCPPASPSSPKR